MTSLTGIDQIQPARQLGFALKTDSAELVELIVPLTGNLNDKQTMFAGSQFSGMVLAGWKLAGNLAHTLGIETSIVIKTTEMDFNRPGTTDLLCRAKAIGEPVPQPSGNLKILIEVVGIDANDKVVAKMHGDYRALIPKA